MPSGGTAAAGRPRRDGRGGTAAARRPRRDGAARRRLRLSGPGVSSPVSRRRAVAVLERAAEGRLRGVADVLRDERDRNGGVAEQAGGGVQAYVHEIGGRRLADASDEPSGERRP